MALYNITGYTNIAFLTGKTAASDVYNVNGGYLFIDQDSRVGYGTTTGSCLGNMTLSATLGGTVEVNATKVRLIQYNSGVFSVSGGNTPIRLGDASGMLIGVYSGLGFHPAASGTGMPATGYLKVKNWNGVPFGTGAATGIGVTLVGPDRPGWIELVGVDGLTCTVNRLNNFIVSGDWFDLEDTTADRNSRYQIPTNGQLCYHPGVWVEKEEKNGQFEFYPCAGSYDAKQNMEAWDKFRGKICWIDTSGRASFGYDYSGRSNGYVPPAGLRVRVPSVMLTNCAAATQNRNVFPNATLTTRYKFATSNAGVIDMDKASVNWHTLFAQPYSVQLKNVGILTQLNVSEIASPIAWEQVGIGQEAANTQNALLMATCFAGGTASGCTWTRAALATAVATNSITDVSNVNFIDDKTFNFAKRLNANSVAATLTRVNNCNWIRPTIGGGRFSVVTCSNLLFSGTKYFDTITGRTASDYPMYTYDLSANCNNVMIDGLDFGGLTGLQPYNGVLNIGTAGCSNISLRNLGTPSEPLDMGGKQRDYVTYNRVSTSATGTSINHGLVPGQIIYVPISQETATVAIGAKTVLLTPDKDRFTFACTNAGPVTGRSFSYYPTVSAYLFGAAATAAANTVKVQRCYTPHLRTNLYTLDNSTKNVLVESVQGDYANIPVTPQLNGYHKGMSAVPSLAAQTSCYGTHWIDWFTTSTPANLTGIPWARVTTNITGYSTGHDMRTADQIVVTESSAPATLPLGLKTITGYTNTAFVFGGTNAGPTDGTFSYVPLNGRIGLVMNESTSDTAGQYTIDSGTPAFTSAGGLFMPTPGQQITFTTPAYVLNHASFPIALPIMAGGAINNYQISYALDKNNGVGFGPFYNLSYQYTGCTGTIGTYQCNVNGGAAFETVATGDYVWGAGVAFNAKVVALSGTALNTDLPHTAAINGPLFFNHAPSETGIDPSLGFKMKMRIQTRLANAQAITSLYTFTNSTSGSRAYQYPLDTAATSLVITNLQPGTEVHVYDTNTTQELAGVESTAGSTFSYPYTWAGVDTNTFITVTKPGYQWIRYDNQVLGRDGLTIPSFQLVDRNYSNLPP